MLLIQNKCYQRAFSFRSGEFRKLLYYKKVLVNTSLKNSTQYGVLTSELPSPATPQNFYTFLYADFVHLRSNHPYLQKDTLLKRCCFSGHSNCTAYIIHPFTYIETVNDFLTSNQFYTLTRDPTEKYKKQLLKALQHSDKIINKHIKLNI